MLGPEPTYEEQMRVLPWGLAYDRIDLAASKERVKGAFLMVCSICFLSSIDLLSNQISRERWCILTLLLLISQITQHISLNYLIKSLHAGLFFMLLLSSADFFQS